MLVDNNEVKVMKINGAKMGGKMSKKSQQKDAFDGYLQRKAFFVIPQIDRLKKEKIELK